MKILVTGAGGFLGRRIAASLLRQGAVDLRLHFRNHPPPSMMEDLQRDYPDARIEAVGANLLARTFLDAMFEGVDCVVHSAAGMRGAPADMFANTVVGTRNLLDGIARQHVRRVVLISSFAVFRTAKLSRGATLDETAPAETVGIDKGPYGYAKIRQEQLLTEYQRREGFEAVILRPGVIYGPGGGALSPRVGIAALGCFFSLGGGAVLPLSYVDNCADAVATVTLRAPAGTIYSVVDDHLPSCRAYLRAYRRAVRPLRTLPVPYWALLLGSYLLVRYNRISKGQLPAIFTPHVVRSMYRPLCYSNAALKSLGWLPRVPPAEGMRITFQYLRSRGV